MTLFTDYVKTLILQISVNPKSSRIQKFKKLRWIQNMIKYESFLQK